MSTVPFVGSKISLISKSEIRYVGRLLHIDTAQNTVTLTKVQVLGTENRVTDPKKQIPAKDTTFDKVVFKGSDIKDLTVTEAPPSEEKQEETTPATSSVQPPKTDENAAKQQASTTQQPTQPQTSQQFPNMSTSAQPQNPQNQFMPGMLPFGGAFPQFGMPPMGSMFSQPINPQQGQGQGQGQNNQNQYFPFFPNPMFFNPTTMGQNPFFMNPQLTMYQMMQMQQQMNANAVKQQQQQAQQQANDQKETEEQAEQEERGTKEEQDTVEKTVEKEEPKTKSPRDDHDRKPREQNKERRSQEQGQRQNNNRPQSGQKPQDFNASTHSRPTGNARGNNNRPHSYANAANRSNNPNNQSNQKSDGAWVRVPSSNNNRPNTRPTNVRTQFEGDFDFTEANSKFNKEGIVEEIMGMIKQENETEGDDQSKSTNSNNVSSANKKLLDMLPSEEAYNKNDFFDRISCDALEKLQGTSRPQRPAKRDSETFGDITRRPYSSGGRGGRGGRSQRGGSQNNGGRQQYYSNQPKTKYHPINADKGTPGN